MFSNTRRSRSDNCGTPNGIAGFPLDDAMQPNVNDRTEQMKPD
jgi:hypothetical protein